jgi:hypothetical protein
MTIQNIIKHQHLIYGSMRNLLLGGGLCYAVENKRYIEIPITFLVPSIYAGYHLFKNKEHVAAWLKSSVGNK